MIAPVKISSFWSRWLIPYLFILLATCIVFLLAVCVAYPIGRQQENKRLFSVNYRDQYPDEFRTEFIMDYILNSTEYNDIIFHGDSTCQFGANAKLFENQTSLKAFNIGTIVWIGWSGYALLLDQYLEHHPKPKIVMFCIDPVNVAELRRNSYIWEERVVWAYGSGKEETRPRHINGARDYIRQGILTIGGFLIQGSENLGYRQRNVQGFAGLTTGELIEQLNSRRGTSRFPTLKRTPQMLPKQIADFSVPSNASQYIRKMAELTKSKDIIFALRLMPVWKDAGVFATDEESVYDKLRVFEQEFDNVVIMQPAVLEYDQSLFYDKEHLNELGSTKLTTDLEEQVTDILHRKR